MHNIHCKNRTNVINGRLSIENSRLDTIVYQLSKNTSIGFKTKSKKVHTTFSKEVQLIIMHISFVFMGFSKPNFHQPVLMKRCWSQ